MQRVCELAVAHQDKDLALLALLTHQAVEGPAGADVEARRLLELGAKIAQLAASTLTVALEGRAERPLTPAYVEGKGQQLRYLAETLYVAGGELVRRAARAGVPSEVGGERGAGREAEGPAFEPARRRPR
jgi:hypothetical protein